MSRGLGIWQRAILTALEQYDLGPVGTIAFNALGRDPTRSELVSIRRAARRLAEDGTILALHLGQCRACGELSTRFVCRVCSAGCVPVLVVVRPDLDLKLPSVQARNGLPPWVSVASGKSAPQATLTGVVGG